MGMEQAAANTVTTTIGHTDITTIHGMKGENVSISDIANGRMMGRSGGIVGRDVAAANRITTGARRLRKGK